jgi:dTDP-4-dehydrorhamnose reductase
MRILLTGTSGQVGGALQAALPGSYEVRAPQRSEFDLARPESLGEALDALKPDLILNPAAYTAVDRAEDERELAFRINAEAPSIIARWAARHGVPLLHFSTDYVFDGTGERPWREEDPCQPLSAYGQSKLAGEIGIREAAGSHLIVRTSWVFAAKGANFLRTIIRLARERTELRIVSDQIGAPTSARSIADAVAKLVNGNAGDIRERFASAHGVVHLTNSGSTSWHGFASAIVEGLRARDVALKVGEVLPIATRDFPTKAARPANSRLDLARLNGLFGVTTPSWQAAVDTELDAVVRAEAVAPGDKPR